MIKRILQAGFCLTSFAALSCAQTGVGQIQGTVTDPSGAVVPNATIVLTNVQTDNRFQTTSSGVGFYVFPSLVPGEYSLTVTAPGMLKWDAKATLVAGQRAQPMCGVDDLGEPACCFISSAWVEMMIS